VSASAQLMPPVGDHHSTEFLTSSPAVILAAVAARTTGIRLTCATTLLGVVDPVRVYEDFASLDVISWGRAELRRPGGRAQRAAAGGWLA
jgi:alkanesulfonate monooxygenase SsuD/methylene tetrahydromethanopterin reductase-like flavin-dependent oxidoreductase (luciferase family)